MKDLPEVSLIAYDNTSDPERTLKVIQHCRRFFRFASANLVCRRHPNGTTDENIFIVEETGYAAAQQFESVTLGDYIHTSHSLYVSHDGYIVNPDKWTDEWLRYDFVGAPWPVEIVSGGFRVGNTGFCLRSRKFMNLCSLSSMIYRDDIPSDVFACQFMRPLFEFACGVKYAPISVAADFAWEITIPEYPAGRPDAFGFHKNPVMMQMTQPGVAE